MVHDDFILTPISKVLEDVYNATDCIDVSIATYPLCDYIMLSLFMKMTGFQEQKMKCLCWEMASVDFEFRRETFENWPYSTCSEYKHKNQIFGKMLSLLCDRIPNYEFTSDQRKDIIKSTKDTIDSFYNASKIKSWLEKSYHDYSISIDAVAEDCILQGGKELFANCANCSKKGSKTNPRTCSFPEGHSLHCIYMEMYNNRNRCAHNVSSYQQNLPKLDTLSSAGYVYRNYLLHFAILVLIDNIFIHMYKQWLEVI